MERHKGVVEAPSLGTYLCGLRPGCACVCCGAPLRWIDNDKISRPTEWTRARSEEGRILACPDCGCEIRGVSTERAAAKAGSTLTRAA